MKQYRKRAVVIEAVQWDGTAAGATPIIDWILDGGCTARYHAEIVKSIMPYRPDDINHETIFAYIAVDTLEGTMKAARNDWIIRGVEGEFYPCKPHIFELTYEEVDE